jgi:hypothetical protein
LLKLRAHGNSLRYQHKNVREAKVKADIPSTKIGTETFGVEYKEFLP